MESRSDEKGAQMSTRVSADCSQRWEQLNRNAGSDASAQESTDRIEKAVERVGHGSSGDMPDPVTL
jgi:hypothetical protein